MVPISKSSDKYVCEKCDYQTSRKSQYERHLATDKHKILQNPISKKFQYLTPKQYKCGCGKVYKHPSSMYAHRKHCEGNDHSDKINKDELIHLLVTQNNEMMQILKNGLVNNNTTNNTNTNNNSHNTTNNVDTKTFNLNFFLNETCKNAMNISEFVSSIKVNLQDLENTGKQGYIQGISNIILKNLNNMEQNFRPIHCSDSKREVLYIKDNNEWTKETDEKPLLTKAIKVIANENIKQIKHWINKYPDCTDPDSKKNNMYLKIVSNSMNGSTQEEGCKNIDKIISNVAKEVIIDKSQAI